MVTFFSRNTKESANMPIPVAPKKEEGHEEEKRAPPAPKRMDTTSPPITRAQQPGTPPLFIKIDKYGEVVKNVQRLKSFALGLRDALDALSDIEKELSTGLTIANRALDNFNTTVSMLDSKLLRLAGTNVTDTDIKIPDELDNYIKNVYDQMGKLKHELKTIQ